MRGTARGLLDRSAERRRRPAVLDRAAEDLAALPGVWPMKVRNAVLVALRRGRSSHGDVTVFLGLLAAQAAAAKVIGGA